MCMYNKVENYMHFHKTSSKVLLRYWILKFLVVCRVSYFNCFFLVSHWMRVFLLWTVCAVPRIHRWTIWQWPDTESGNVGQGSFGRNTRSVYVIYEKAQRQTETAAVWRRYRQRLTWSGPAHYAKIAPPTTPVAPPIIHLSCLRCYRLHIGMP